MPTISYIFKYSDNYLKYIFIILFIKFEYFKQAKYILNKLSFSNTNIYIYTYIVFPFLILI